MDDDGFVAFLKESDQPSTDASRMETILLP